jgi:acetyl-CoA C-acetyltransferase
LNPRTPVLVGVAAVQQRLDDATQAKEPVELMIDALLRAADDAGCRELLSSADAVMIPRGFWDYPDPGRLIAERFGAAAKTTVAEIGILQTTLFAEAAQAIVDGGADVVLVTGGEARHRALRAQIAGVEATLTAQLDRAPDRVLKPAADIISPPELHFDLTWPVRQYALMENALRFAEGVSVEAHRREVAQLWAAMSEVAAANPDAWRRQPVSVRELTEPSDKNRMLAFPYTKLHNSQWNVDQAAGLIFCAAEKAQRLGIPRHRWVIPRAVADSNLMLPVSERADLGRCPAFAIAGRRASTTSGVSLDDVKHFELYSCFPIAVRMQMREIAIRECVPITVTGGMAFAGGPLNNFVLQAMVRMAEVLRADPGSVAMVNAVSGMLTKQGVSLWSTESGPPFRHVDVSEEAAAETRTKTVRESVSGSATVATYTVLYQGPEPEKAIVLADVPDGTRTIGASTDADLMAQMVSEEFCGREIELDGGGGFQNR